MSHTVKIVFGKEQVIKIYQDLPLTEEEQRLNVKEFSFETEAEKNAFCIGIDEAVGWTEYYIPEYEFGKIKK